MHRLALALLFAAASTLHAQQDFSKVNITVVPVAKGVYMLQGAGGNIGLSVGNDDAFIIDDQYGPLTAKIKAAIATVTPKPVRFVMNTHWHGDHTGGNENMAVGGAIIVAHENVRRRMSVDQFIEVFKQKEPASPAAALPVITFTEGISFYLNGDSVRAMHVRNAHTDGDAIIVFQGANVIHMGDTFFNGMYPYIDVSTGGSLAGIVAAADRALALANDSTKIIPGHGALADKATLRKYRDVMADARDRVARLIAQKKTLAQIVAAKPLAAYDSAWGNGFIKPDLFLALVHAGMTKAPVLKPGAPHHAK